jgi:ribosomal protein L13
MDCGDYVIVINADKIRLTGNKLTDKVYVRHTGYPGGQRFTTPKKLLEKKPIAVIEHAVKGMLPKINWEVNYLEIYMFLQETNIYTKLKNQNKLILKTLNNYEYYK